MAYIKGSTNAIRRRWTLRGVRGRGLGTVSTMVGGSLVYGSNVLPATASISNNLRRAYPFPRPMPPVVVGPAYPVWGGNPPRAYPNWGNNANNPNNPSSQNNLAQLTLQYQANPSSLTLQQWQQLQAAGVIAPTVPYSNAGLVNPTGAPSTASSGIDPTTGIPYAQELATAQAATPASSVMGVDPVTGATTIFGVDWYWVVGAGAVLLFVMTGKRGR